MAVIERYFSSDESLQRVTRDFGNLIKIINRSHGELSIQLRKDYFNVYYRGNSLARIAPIKRGKYEVRIHGKFVADPVETALSRWPSTKRNSYRRWIIDGRDAGRFFAKSIIIKIGARIAAVNNGEEITFEQILMTDNSPTKQLVIIDRQITDSRLRKQMDILALSRPSGSGAFKFLVIEVKLGKNPELRGKVAIQLREYVDHIRNYIGDYIKCYRRNYAQKHQLGLLNFDGAQSSIEIEPCVEGMVVVGGYTGLAADAIKELKNKYPEVHVKEMRNSLV